MLLGIGGWSPKFLGGLLSGFRVVAIPELLGGVSGGSLFLGFLSLRGVAQPPETAPIPCMPKMLGFPQKLPILVLTKTLQVWLCFIVGFGFFWVSLQKSSSGFGSGKNSQVQVFVGFDLDPLHH